MSYPVSFHTIDISSSRFLVTGGAGFIGSHITDYLLQHGAGEVVVLDNLSTGFKKNIQPYFDLPNFRFIEGDICNSEDCARAMLDVDYVFHLAALGSVPRSINNPLATHGVNLSGFLNVLIAAREAKVKRIVYSSSSSVYGDNVDSPKKEEITGTPLSPYAVTKKGNELYASVFVKNYGMEIIGLRYFNIFGPRQDPHGAYAAVLPLFMHAIIRNEPPFINGDGTQSRDFTYIENAVQGNIKSMFTTNRDAIGGIFNIAIGENYSINQLFHYLKEISGSKLDAIYREARQGDIKDSLACITKAQTLLGYEPRVKALDGLQLTFKWFQEHFKHN